jgi:hypothetical protein
MIVTEYSSGPEDGEILEPRSDAQQDQGGGRSAAAQPRVAALASTASLSTTKRKKLKKALKAAAAASGASASSAAAAAAGATAASGAAALSYFNIYGDNVSRGPVLAAGAGWVAHRPALAVLALAAAQCSALAPCRPAGAALRCNAARPPSAPQILIPARPAGPQPRASIQVVPEQVVRLSDVQGLVLWVLGESLCPRWAFIKVRARLPARCPALPQP